MTNLRLIFMVHKFSFKEQHPGSQSCLVAKVYSHKVKICLTHKESSKPEQLGEALSPRNNYDKKALKVDIVRP